MAIEWEYSIGIKGNPQTLTLKGPQGVRVITGPAAAIRNLEIVRKIGPAKQAALERIYANAGPGADSGKPSQDQRRR